MQGVSVPRVAIVTGASRGIGAASASLLAERGFRVAVNCRSTIEEAEKVVAAIDRNGGEAMAIRADVTAQDEVADMVRLVTERWGAVDALVHNALTPYAIVSFADLTWEQLSVKVDQELHAAYLLAKAVVPGMVERGYGRLVFMSTGLSRQARPDMITLGTAKAALDQFVRYMALELAPHGITANLVAPSTVGDTEVVSTGLTPDVIRRLSEANPMGRLARAEDVARAVAYFASDEASYTTGSYATVNGGLLMV